MKYRLYLLLFSLLLLNSPMWAQKVIPQKTGSPKAPSADQIKINSQNRHGVPRAPQSVLQSSSIDYSPLAFPGSLQSERGLVVKKDPATGLPIAIHGKLGETQVRSGASIEEQVDAYLEAAKATLGIKQPKEEFVISDERKDAMGITHVRLQQMYRGLPVYSSELILHSKDGQPYLLNGRYFPSPDINQLTPAQSAEKAIAAALADVQIKTTYSKIKQQHRHLINGEQQESELVIYHLDKAADQERLTWHITLRPNLAERWEYFVDAQSGELLHHYRNGCQFYFEHGEKATGTCKAGHNHTHKSTATNADFRLNGSEIATATDLNGLTRTLNVYETGGTYFMIDAERDMFNSSLSNFPDNTVGTIWSIDANNTAPQNSNFRISHITSGNNLWNSRTAVSAHFNGGEAYAYFKNTFNRNSINGDGGNIVSIINVADEDGSDMDNAFWNGNAIFYGNGNVAFNAPLAKALDVAGHEMSHGVIQNTANLDYENESGAMNESFADIFGAMIDRDDWKIGEEVANSSTFPTGTMRDMQNPNNGGNQFGDRGWQPKHMNEFVNLPNTPQGDNGGVHINSGIPNHAYYLYATDPAVGKSKAEQIFYLALTDYLTRSSRFIDLRLGVIEAAKVRHGANSAEVAAAERAFNAVGIGSGTSTNTQTEVGVNPGQDFVLWSNDQLTSIRNALTNGTDDGAFSNTPHLSKPSLTDDGSIILFVDDQGAMKEIDIDWATGMVLNEFVLEETLKWRNVATSRDGNRLAAVTGDLNNGIFDDSLFVFDFISGDAVWYELYNPTFSQGVSTGDVLFADVLEWDFAGESVIYDAANQLSNNNGDDITYWDIGIINVWDNQANDFGSGTVKKLFSGLGETESVGNPTFSKNSPHIVAFDFIENVIGGTEYSVMGVNTQTGDFDEIFAGNALGYPNYSKDDDKVIFSFNQNGTQKIIAIRDIETNKIRGTGDATIFIENANWGVWFATGERDLTANEEVFGTSDALKVYPNPFSGQLNVVVEAEANEEAFLSVIDPMGRVLLKERHKLISGANYLSPNLDNLTPGTYFVLLNMDNKLLSARVVRQQ